MAKKEYGTLSDIRELIREDINGRSKNPIEILLDVAKKLSEITGEENYYTEIRDSIVATYGYVFQDKYTLELELKAVTERRQKIKATLDNNDFDDYTNQRITFALQRHNKEIERLNALIAAQK